MTSRSSTFRFLAKHHHTRDTGTHKNLKLTEEVIATMMEHPSTTGGRLAAEARKRIARIDEESLTIHASSLAKEHDLFAIKEKDDELWSSTMAKRTTPPSLWLHQWTPSLTTPTSADRRNLSDLYTICCRIGRQSKQTLAHILSHCQAALQPGRYNTQHDRILETLFKHLQQHLPPGTKVVADLAGQPYTLPVSLPTDLRPDLVVHSPGQLHLLELTVCWEANFLSAKLRQESKYLHLLEQACSVGTQGQMQRLQQQQEPPPPPLGPGTNQH